MTQKHGCPGYFAKQTPRGSWRGVGAVTRRSARAATSALLRVRERAKDPASLWGRVKGFAPYRDGGHGDPTGQRKTAPDFSGAVL